ncbi:MAG TPA: HPP family protein [Dehalococcoidia bacterium]|nr:HPP family protein [Dehalococcoidia bacterium]
MSNEGQKGSPDDQPPRPWRLPRIDLEHPIGGEMSEVVLGLVRRVQLPYLEQRYHATPVLALFSLINGFISIALMALTALVTEAPFVFPSLGPTAFLFFYTPTAATAAPRNTIVGHAVGAAVGWLSLVVFGLTHSPAAVTEGVSLSRVGAAALSLGLTSGVMVLLRSPHPPAGATTLIVSLGLMAHLWQLGVLMLAVVLLTGQAIVINRLAGVPYPLWAPRAETPPATG